MEQQTALEQPWVEQQRVAWRDRIQTDHPTLKPTTTQSIVDWLIGENPERFAELDTKQLRIAEQAMLYRYRILGQRYLNVSPTRAYRNLISRLGALMVVRNKIRTWVSLSRDRNRAVADVLQEVIQEMLNSDRYIQATVAWISHCTTDERLRNTLLLTSVEEYCLRPIRNQPLLVFRFVNYLRRSQKGGMTQVPQKERVRMLSEEITLDDGDSAISLFDTEAVSHYEYEQDWEQQQRLRQEVQTEFEQYLAQKVDPIAVEWLQLYLQGCPQEMIAQKLGVPVKQIYRLREKVSYHAIKIFALKGRPDLVANWLQTSLQEHSLGLTPGQWSSFWADLTEMQQSILGRLKMGSSIEAIAKEMGVRKTQVMAEWGKVYQMALDLRSE
ncbi:MAG: HetZ-related protein 2 [Spirulina sp. SIO3F2]|nr:HetZ-related protein 2 [Spirulina sp. SIO3F2]